MQALTADLNVFTLASMLQAAESDQATGAFQLRPEGSLVLHRGAVVDAVYGRLTGIEAALTLLMVRSTEAVFEPFEVAAKPTLIDTMALIIDGARLNDDWGTLAPQVLQLRDGVDIERFSSPVQRALKALNGNRVVNEALDLYAIDVIQVIDDLLDLRESGDLVEAAPPRPEAVKLGTATPAPARQRASVAAPAETDFFKLVDDSRSALRNKDYATALGLLEQAQSLRPDDRTVDQNIRRIRQLIKNKT